MFEVFDPRNGTPIWTVRYEWLARFICKASRRPLDYDIIRPDGDIREFMMCRITDSPRPIWSVLGGVLTLMLLFVEAIFLLALLP